MNCPCCSAELSPPLTGGGDVFGYCQFCIHYVVRDGDSFRIVSMNADKAGA